jgi:hypothetical protein
LVVLRDKRTTFVADERASLSGSERSISRRAHVLLSDDITTFDGTSVVEERNIEIDIAYILCLLEIFAESVGVSVGINWC